ncbi:hypothetical protein GCM10007148_07030 [Parvularcula lutaonensis]|nr:hypothetical protein GCM10007148_07030 [Parvularcula lutaonensis]
MAALSLGFASADWKESYRAYQAAMQSGDGQAALVHARTAWEDAKVSLPVSENRAALAQNFATIAMFSDDPAAALPALEDAILHAEQGFGTSNYDLPNLLFFRAYVRSAEKPRNMALALAAVEAAEGVTGNAILAPHSALARRLLAKRLIEREAGDKAFDLMTPLTDQAFSKEGYDLEALQADLSLRMVAAFSDLPIGERFTNLQPEVGADTFIDRLEKVLFDWRRHMNRFPPQKSIETYNPVLAKTEASEGLTTAYYRSYANGPRVEAFIASLPRRRTGIIRSERCDAIKWKKNPMRFPASQSGYNGAVIVGFHLNRDGKVEGERLLAEIPADRFGERAVKQVGKFWADTTGVSDACLRNRRYDVQFYTKP